MKRILPLFLCFLVLFLSACGEQKELFITEPLSQSVENEGTETNPSPELTVPPASSSDSAQTPTENTEPHSHLWSLASLREASCREAGERLYRCICGASYRESFDALSHSYASQGCGKPSLCSLCGEQGDYIPHTFRRNTCLHCGTVIDAPIYVLNTELYPEEPTNSVLQKLGTPTETLTEGAYESLIYASDLARLTVLQIKAGTLWGVFTLDPDAFFNVNSCYVDAENFSGQKDSNSDTRYMQFAIGRLYAFRDTLGTGKHYGFWFRSSDSAEYNYMTEPALVQSYAVQSRISYYFVNALRAKNGLTALSWSPAAAAVSEAYSRRMASENFFYHDHQYGQRLSEAGVLWRSCGENLSQGFTSAYFVCDAYYNCADHRTNLLDHSFTHVGIGFALQSDSNGPLYVLGTQTFYA